MYGSTPIATSHCPHFTSGPWCNDIWTLFCSTRLATFHYLLYLHQSHFTKSHLHYTTPMLAVIHGCPLLTWWCPSLSWVLDLETLLFTMISLFTFITYHSATWNLKSQSDWATKTPLWETFLSPCLAHLECLPVLLPQPFAIHLSSRTQLKPYLLHTILH